MLARANARVTIASYFVENGEIRESSIVQAAWQLCLQACFDVTRDTLMLTCSQPDHAGVVPSGWRPGQLYNTTTMHFVFAHVDILDRTIALPCLFWRISVVYIVLAQNQI
jgi:hypothetical protein